MSHLIAVLHQHKFHFTRVFSVLKILKRIFSTTLYVALKKIKTAATVWNVSAQSTKTTANNARLAAQCFAMAGFFKSFPQGVRRRERDDVSLRTVCVGFMASALKVLNFVFIMIGKSLCGEFDFGVKCNYKLLFLLRFNKIWSSNFQARKDL